MEILIIIVLSFVILYALFSGVHENFADTAGALMQLAAKGPEDSYLTVGTDKYVPEYWWGLYPAASYYPWNYWSWNRGGPLFSYYNKKFPYYGSYPVFVNQQ